MTPAHNYRTNTPDASHSLTRQLWFWPHGNPHPRQVEEILAKTPPQPCKKQYQLFPDHSANNALISEAQPVLRASIERNQRILERRAQMLSYIEQLTAWGLIKERLAACYVSACTREEGNYLRYLQGIENSIQYEKAGKLPAAVWRTSGYKNREGWSNAVIAMGSLLSTLYRDDGPSSAQLRQEIRDFGVNLMPCISPVSE